MAQCSKRRENKEAVFVGVDVHLKSWHVTVITAEGEELFQGGIPGKWEALQSLLARYGEFKIHVAYEAGFCGFWIYDRLVAWGTECTVVPPSLLPIEYGNRVKTDRRDSRKLAHLLSKGMLKRVWVPSVEERYHRQVVRRRRQLIQDRVRTQNRIKSELKFYGIELPESAGKWSRRYFTNLKGLRFRDRWMQMSFTRLLETYVSQDEQIQKQTRLLKELSETDRYRDQVKILRSIPGIGLIAAMELLLELGDVSRFPKGGQLAAYVGLTPSQYSSGERVRMGRICKAGKNSLRGTLIEASWILIAKDPAMREKYNNIKARAGGKRAVVAIARMLLLRVRRMLLDKKPYVVGLVA